MSVANPSPDQHFVPRCYLKHFSNDTTKENAQVVVLNTKTGSQIFTTAIHNVCQQRNLYTLDFPGIGAIPSDILDKFYNESFEIHYNELYRMLTDEKLVEITDAQRQLIVGTIVSMHYRVAKWLNESTNFQKEAIMALTREADKKGVDSVRLSNGSIWNIRGKSIDELLNELEVERKMNYFKDQVDGISDIIQAKIYNSILIYRAFGEHEFLTSDVPVVVNNGEAKLVTQIVEESHLSVSINPKTLVVILPEPSSSPRLHRISLPDNNSFLFVGIQNDHQFRNAERHLIGTKSGISSFVENRLIYDSNEAISTIQKRATDELENIMEQHRRFFG